MLAAREANNELVQFEPVQWLIPNDSSPVRITWSFQAHGKRNQRMQAHGCETLMSPNPELCESSFPNTPGRKELTHDRILDVAARAIRRAGYDGVGVADIMKEASLTHGGFYAHFASRNALLAEAVQRAGLDSEAVLAARMRQGQAEGVTRSRSPMFTSTSPASTRR